ncbi:MAG: hypothetical protein KUG79_05245 [Pseudomonadales bacterium]|nr:hypothetical protein [Pseudomonadales bacterium]
MKKVMLAVGVLAILIIGLLAFMMINVNSLVKNGVEIAGQEVLGVAVTVESVDISFFSGSGEIRNLKIANPRGYESPYAIEIDQLVLALNAASLTSDVVHIEHILIDAPKITWEGNPVRNNLKDLQQNANDYAPAGEKSSTDTAASEASGPTVQIDELTISNAELGVFIPLLDQPLNLIVPVVQLTDLGKDESTSPAEVINEIFVALNKSIIPLIKANNTGANQQLIEAGKELGNKLKNLFR